jgi:TolB-like protein/DNA-binding winged helix-turn-helix (wHTH) protein/Tfp pilus assembly protein PilF
MRGIAARKINALRCTDNAAQSSPRMGNAMDPGIAQPTSYRFGDVEVDARRHRVLRAGAELALEPKALAALLVLLRHAGDVVARDALLDAVWGHRHVTPAVLNRIVAILRRELGDAAEHPRWIRTVHGVGYEFIGALEASSAEAAAASEASAPPESQAAPPRVRAWRAVSWALALAAVAAAVASWMSSPRGAPPAVAVTASARNGVAVLPLVNAGGDPAQQFFSDGLSDNLIDALSKFEGVKVVGRMSSFRFRDSSEDSRSIGAALGVAYLVSGSVQHVDDTVRVGVELSSVADGQAVWANHYDRPYKDLFALQDEIAQSIAGALHAKLLSPDAAAMQGDRPPSGDIAAYNAYLQGLKYWHDEDFPSAARYMRQAVQLDPGYAVAWAHLSGALSTVATFSSEAPADVDERMREARAAVDKALQLAPDLGQAHAARAYLAVYTFDRPNALVECRRAVQLTPEDATALNGCGFVLAQIGKLAEGMQLRERLLSIEPLYTVNHIEIARLLVASGRLDEAAKRQRIAESLLPPGSHTSYEPVYVAIVRGDAKAATDMAAQIPAAYREPYLMLAAQIGPDRAAADAALAKVVANEALAGSWFNTRAYLIAQAYALRGDSDGTLQWLERAATRDFLFLPTDPIILRFRDDPRLIALCGKLGLTPPAESDALSLDRIRTDQNRAALAKDRR